MNIIIRFFFILFFVVSIFNSYSADNSSKKRDKLLTNSEKQPEADSSSKKRDKLFKCDLISKILDRECHNILRRICLRQGKIPDFPLGTIPLTNSEKQSERDFFMKSIAATVNCVNKIIRQQRKFVMQVQDKKQRHIPLTEGEKEQFDMICEFYQTENIADLLLRVDQIPVSLAVAQASLESGYGRDKTIHSLNAYFGLAKTKTELLSFDSLYKSAVAYAKTLNVNICYREFRKQRAVMMSQSKKIDGAKLSPFLKLYGTDGNYRKLVLKIINFHGLASLDR